MCNVGHRRPDLAWVTASVVISVEVDEDSHSSRDPSCELKKAQDTRYGAEGGIAMGRVVEERWRALATGRLEWHQQSLANWRGPYCLTKGNFGGLRDWKVLPSSGSAWEALLC